MEFRYIALLAVWTLISGPIISVSSGPSSPPRKAKPAAAVQLVKPAAPTPR